MSNSSHKLTADLLALRPVMEAFLKGESIEVKTFEGKWVDIEKPSWLPTVEYRVKPKPYEGWMAVCENDNRRTSPIYGTKTGAEAYVKAVSLAPELWKIIFIREVK